MAYLTSAHFQQGVGAHLGEAEVSEGQAPQAHLVFTGGEVHNVLLSSRLFPWCVNQPELV